MARLVVAAVVLALGCVACSDDGPTHDATTPTSITTLPPTEPGTPLGDDLVVPAGAEIVGRVFPGVGYPDRWDALLYVKDGPAAYAALMGQAEAAGFVQTEYSTPCQNWVEADVHRTQCAGDLARGVDKLSVYVDVGSCGPAGASHAVVRGSSAPDVSSSPTTRTVATPPATVPAHEGDLVNPRDDVPIAPVRLEPGTRLAGPSWVSCHFSGQHRSVLVVEAPVDDVIDRYAAQWMRHIGRDIPATVTTREVDGARLTGLSIDIAGGDMWNMTVVEETGQPTLAVIDTGTDP